MDKKNNFDPEEFGKVLGSILQQSKEHEDKKDLEKSTNAIFEIYKSFVEAGFREDQALKIVSDMFSSILIMNIKSMEENV